MRDWEKIALSALLFVLALLVAPYFSSTDDDTVEEVSEVAKLEKRIENLEKKQNALLQNQVDIMKNQMEILKLQEKMIETLLKLFGTEKEITGYAPLDSRAVEGMCFSGDPSITASGLPLIPNWTIAAGEKYPFGTLMWIEGIGLRQVHDRGGMISDNHIDVAVNTREQAFAIGRGFRRVVVIRKGE